MKRVGFPNPGSFLLMLFCVGLISFWKDREERDLIYLILTALLMSEAVLLFLSDPSQNYHNERNPLINQSFRKKNNTTFSAQLSSLPSYNRHPLQLSLKFCETCKLSMQEDTEHCTQCGVCILGFQNHCIYVSNCIGSSNKYFFYIFLFTLQIWNLSNLKFSILLLLTKGLSIFPFLLTALVLEGYLLAVSLLKCLL